MGIDSIKRFFMPNKTKLAIFIVLFMFLVASYILLRCTATYSFWGSNSLTCTILTIPLLIPVLNIIMYAIVEVISIPLIFLWQPLAFFYNIGNVIGAGGPEPLGIAYLLMLLAAECYIISCIIERFSKRLAERAYAVWKHKKILVAVVIIVSLLLVSISIEPLTYVSPLESVKGAACKELLDRGCSVDASSVLVDFDANGDGIQDEADNLQNLCITYYGIGNETNPDDYNCKRLLCGCFGG
jgi:hypothetical protein